MISRPGRQASRSEQLLLGGLISKRSEHEKIIVHHVTEDSPYRLQIEIERRCPLKGIAFERVVL